MERNIEKYKQLNASYTTKAVIHFGTGLGFFSEFNSMVFMVLECLKSKYQFVLYSDDAHFALGNGWNEFFEPFSPQVHNKFHHFFNRRYFINSKYRKLLTTAECVYKLCTNNLLTHDLFYKSRTVSFQESFFYIPELEINGNCKSACGTICRMIYKFNDKYQLKINEIINKLALPQDYVSFHIRSGDKITERELIGPDKYVERIQGLTTCNHIFVATDDYSNIEYLKSKYPQYIYHTLTPIHKRGYDQNSFNNIKDKKSIQDDMLELFATIEILRNSKICIGTYGSNIGMFLGMMMDDDRFISLDYNNWIIL